MTDGPDSLTIKVENNEKGGETMEEKRRPGLLGYFTLALMTTAIVVCVLLMVLMKESSLGLMLGTVPALLVIDWLDHRVELKMGEYLPVRLLDMLVRAVIWAAAVLVLWARYHYADPEAGVIIPDFALLLLVLVQALTLLLRVIHAMGRVKEPKAEKAPEKESEQKEGPKQAEEPQPEAPKAEEAPRE